WLCRCGARGELPPFPHDALPIFQVIAIHGAPRSGTSWLGQVFNSHPQVQYRYQPLFSYAFKGRVGAHSSRQEFLDLFADLATTEDRKSTRLNSSHVKISYAVSCL